MESFCAFSSSLPTLPDDALVQGRGGTTTTAKMPSSFAGASTSGTLAPPLATVEPLRSLSGRGSPGTPCVASAPPPQRTGRAALSGHRTVGP